MDDWDNNPAGRAYIKDFLKNGLPKIEGAAVSVSIMDGDGSDFDTKQATEIGAILLLGKPLILIATPGAVLPPGLVRAADTIVSDWTPDAKDAHKRITDAVNALLKD